MVLHTRTSPVQLCLASLFGILATAGNGANAAEHSWEYAAVDLPQAGTECVTAVAIDEGHNRLLAGFKDGKIAAWDVKNTRSLFVNRLVKEPVSFVGPDEADGNSLLVGSGGALRRIPLTPGRAPERLSEASFKQLAQSPDGTKVVMLFSGKSDYAAVLTVKRSKFSKPIPLNSGAGRIAVDNDGSKLAVAYHDSVVVMNVDDPRIVSRFPNADEGGEVAIRITRLAFSNSCSVLVVGFDEVDGLTSGVSTLDYGRSVLARQIHSIMPDHFAVSPCGRWLAIAGDRTMCLYRLPELHLRQQRNDDSRAPYSCVSVASNASLIAVGRSDGIVQLWQRRGAVK